MSPEYVETGEGTPKAYDREIRLADAELAVGMRTDVEEAETAFRSLLSEARQTADRAAETRARVGLGLALAERGRYGDAIPQLERAEESAAVTPASRPDLYTALGRSYAARGEVRRAVGLFEGCLEQIAEVAPDDRALELRFRSHLSSALTDAGELERARAVLAEAEHQAASGLAAHTRVARYRTLARDASANGEPVAAMAYLRRASGLLEATEDSLELARAHLHASEMLLAEDESDRAGVHLERADRLLDLGAEPIDLATLRTQQAHRAVRDGRSDDAIRLATEALDHLDEGSPAVGSAWHALAAAQAGKGDVESASDSFRRAVELLREAGEWREAMTAYRGWARIMREAGRNQEAFEIIEQATLLTLRNAGTTRRRQASSR